MSLFVPMLLAVIVVSALYPKYIHYIFCIALLSPVLVYTLVYLIDWSPSNLLSLTPYVIAGIVLGGVLFYAGLYLAAEQPVEYIKKSLSGASLALRMPAADLLYQIVVISYEELIWRVFLISALTHFLPLWLCIVVAAGLFWMVHEENWPIGDHSIEFYLFSIALAMLYAYTHSFALVWCAHAVRNFLIISAFASPDNSGEDKLAY